MTRTQARDSAREVLKIIPLVMRTVAAELRAAGELPAPAHFYLLTMLGQLSRGLLQVLYRLLDFAAGGGPLGICFFITVVAGSTLQPTCRVLRALAGIGSL